MGQICLSNIDNDSFTDTLKSVLIACKTMLPVFPASDFDAIFT